MGDFDKSRRLRYVRKTFPYPEETGKVNYMSLGDMERQKILTGQGKFIYRQKII
jgi:hypothetical protein